MKIETNDILHPRIIETCLPLYVNGHYQHAALESMKQVERALREKGLAPKDCFGDRLVNWVLGNGNHITLSVPFGEDLQEKALVLFKGAFGYYRNYAAHDGVKINKTICFRIMILASELLDLVGASEKSLEWIGGVDGLIKAGIFKSAQELIDFFHFLDGQQIIESDVTEYECELEHNGFNKVQEQAMFDFGFITYEELTYPIDYEAGQLDSTLVGEIKLTSDGNRILYELKEKDHKENHKNN
jgi:uncharacterized protein (TIGR02391 family)